MVVGVKAVGLPTPPVAAVYQSNLLPASAVAVRGWAAVPVHKFTGLVTAGRPGTGLTVMVKLACVEQLVFVAVTVMVAVIGDVPVFIAVNGEILPFPVSGNNPIELLHDQLKVVPFKLLENE